MARNSSSASIEYDHASDVRALDGPRAAFAQLFPQGPPTSLLDVGCGAGHWLATAIESGVRDVFGIDGVDIPRDKLLCPPDRFRQHDLTTHIDLGRRFDAAICLEVGEHLDIGRAPILIDTLTRHADLILFSAASRWQIGQDHLNGQWPAWWQQLFNQCGFSCDDAVRWRIWDDPRVDPWYRQNLFVARRNPSAAGTEPRIKAVIHPDMLVHMDQERAQMELGWYGTTFPRVMWAKLRRRLHRRRKR